MSPTLCVFFALDREALYFRRRWPRRRIVRAAPCPTWEASADGARVVVVESGVGAEAADVAADWILRVYGLRPDLCVAAGYAGALAADLPVGSVVLASEVLTSSGESWPTADVSLEGVIKGRVLSLDDLVSEPSEKARLYRQHDAVAVEMESASVAKRCAEAGVNFTCLRAISDAAGDRLPAELLATLQGGRVDGWKLASNLLLRPPLIRDLWGLATRSRLASRRLSQSLLELLACRPAA